MRKISQDTLVFFIPGILGSILNYRGPDEFGVFVDEEVWGSNLLDNLDILANNPNRLLSDQIEPVEVLSEVSFLGIKKDIYGSLLHFCIDKNGLGLSEGINFFPFAYDWREDNRISADKFADFIDSKDDLKSSKIKIIAHSMGGIVTRLMLNQNKSIKNKTDLVFQIATPVEGAAKAYLTLKDRPDFHKIFDWLWMLGQHIRPVKRAQLLATLQNFPSLYQLLPPPSTDTLFNRSGNKYSALDPKIWQANLRHFVTDAITIHKMLSLPITNNLKCIYSKRHKTEMELLVDSQYNVIARSVKVSGDGTVTCSSAFANSRVQSRDIIGGTMKTGHNNMCANSNLKRLLKKAI